MATKETSNNVLRKFGSITVEFFTNNMEKVSVFGRCEVTTFHFEEGISHPYSGILNLITKNAVDFGKLDLNYLYVKINYNINYIYEKDIEGDKNEGDFRTVWALVKTVTNLPKAEKVNPYNGNEKFCYQYQLTLESPLARLNNKQTIFSELKITQILSELLSRGDSQSKAGSSVYNPLLCELDFSRIQDLPQLDTRTLKIQRGQEKALSFFNRILIAYGINYILDFDEKKGVKIIFSCDQGYKKENVLNCTNDLNVASSDINYIYLSNTTLKKNSILFDEAKNSAKELKNSWIDIEADRTDISSIKSSQIKLFYKNICIRNLAVNPKLSAQSAQDIRLEPGLNLNSNIDDISSKYVVENLITDITTIFKDKAKENTVQLKTDCLELVDHPAFIELDDKADGDYFEFDSKKELGCLVHQEVDSLASLDPKQSIDIIEAQACAEDGSIDTTQFASYSKDSAENNDLFYAIITGNNSKLLIKVHTLIESDNTSVKKIMQGQRILVLQKGGTYYLYGYVPEPLAVDEDKWEGITQDIINLKNESSISLQNYKNNDEYIYSLLKTSPQAVESAVMYQALESSDASIHDVTYVDNFRSDVKTQHNDYKNKYDNFQQALTALYNKFENGQYLKDYINSDGSLKDNAPDEVKKVKSAKDEFKSASSKMFELAQNIVKQCHISFIKEESKNVLVYNNKDGFKFNGEDGNFEVTAKNIILHGIEGISLQSSGKITVTSSDSIKSVVGGSSVEVAQTGTTITAGSTFWGSVPEGKDGEDTSDTLTSKFSVETYKGISGTAYSVSLTAANSLKLNGPLASGVALSYGSVKLVGSEIKMQTQGRREQAKNILEYSLNFVADALCTTTSSKKGTFYTRVFKGARYALKFYDKHFVEGSTRERTFTKLSKKKEDKATKIDDARANPADAAKQKAVTKAKWDYAQALLDAIYYVLDTILGIIKDFIDQIVAEKWVDKKNWCYAPVGSSTLKSKMDQAILVLAHIKTCTSLIFASFKTYQSKATGAVPAVSTLSINSDSASFDSQKLEFKFLEQTQADTPVSAANQCALRQVITAANNPAPAAVAPGAVAPGAVAPGAVAPGAVAPGAVAPGRGGGAVGPGAAPARTGSVGPGARPII